MGLGPGRTSSFCRPASRGTRENLLWHESWAGLWLQVLEGILDDDDDMDDMYLARRAQQAATSTTFDQVSSRHHH